MNILFFAQKENAKEKLYMRWIVSAQFEMSFDDYLIKAGLVADNRPKKKETAGDILKKVKGIIG